MALPSLDGQPATQVIPVQGPPASQALPSALLALEIPVVTGVPSQTIPVVSRGVGIAPWDVEGMRSVWDAFDSAVYNGSNQLVSIADKGPDANNMVADVAGMPAGTYNVNGTPTTLPGPPTAANQVLETNLSETINDFTIFLLIPNRGTHSTQRCHFAIRNTSSSFSLLVEASGTLGSLAIKSATATDATIDVGFGTAGAASGAHAILGLRKKGSLLIVDVWYDALDGNGLQGPTRSYHTTTIGAVSAAGMSFGGRGGFALTQWWDTDPLHLAAWGDVAVTDYTMEAMAEWAGARLGFAVPAAVESTEPLAAKYTDGQELHDGTGHLPRDADGYYVSRTTGERLLIDAGYAEGATVGAPRLYTAHGVPVGTVVGVPATGRRNGFQASTGNYGLVTFSQRQITFIGRINFDGLSFGTFETLFNSTVAGSNVQLYGNLTNLRARVWDGISTEYARCQIAAATIGAGWRWIVATYDCLTTGTVYLAAYDDVGALIASDTKTAAGAVRDVAKQYGLAASPGAGGGSDLPWLQGISDVLGLDGAALSAAAAAAIVADLASGATTIDDYAATVSLPTDGLICGAYDPAAPTELYTLSGTGTPVVVARPATSLAALHPTVAVYQGGQELHDGTGHLPRLGTGTYLSRTGVLLSIDAGYAEGATVGAPRLYTAHGVEVGTVVGVPATGRRVGFDTISDTNYASLSLAGTAYTMIAKVNLSTVLVQDSIIVGSAATGERWGFYSQPGQLVCARLNTAGSPVVSSAINTALVGTGVRYLAATYDGSTDSTAVYCFDASGVLVTSDVDARASGPFNLSGPFHVGRARGTGVAFTAGDILLGLGWDGVALNQSAIQSIVSALAAGGTVDDYAATVSLPTDGLICGAYDPAAPTELYTLSGTGTPVVVAAA